MKNIAEMEAGLMKRILLSGSRIFYHIYNIYFAANCRDELSRRIVLRRIVCAELSWNHKIATPLHRFTFMSTFLVIAILIISTAFAQATSLHEEEEECEEEEGGGGGRM